MSIQIENLGKRYQRVPRCYKTLREELCALVRAPFGRRRECEEAFFWALQGVDLEIAAGESWALIGMNGSGKSTLLKILSRITPPSTGEIALRGRVASLLEIGAGFHPELTGRENIFLAAAILGMGRQQVRRSLEAIVAFARIEGFLDMPVKRYSSGMFLRLAFAVMAHLDADLFMIDEVLSAGDLEFQERCTARVRELVAAGRTLLLVSHQLPLLEALAPRAALLHCGRLLCTGATPEVVARYRALCADRLDHD